MTLPILLAVCPASPKLFADLLVLRLMASPFVLAAMGISRWLAGFELAKKWTFRALPVEGVSPGIAAVLSFAGVL